MDTETRPERRLLAAQPRPGARWWRRALLAIAAAAIALLILFAAARAVLHHTLAGANWDVIDLGR
jgi:hypothetical protein